MNDNNCLNIASTHMTDEQRKFNEYIRYVDDNYYLFKIGQGEDYDTWNNSGKSR
jgi:hypothetical protein